MTTKSISDQERCAVQERAVWLARFPAAKTAGGTVHRTRQGQARELAARCGATIVGEFLYAASGANGLDNRVWDEVIDLLRYLNATTLVVLRPDEVSTDFATCLHHRTQLEAAGVRLLRPDDVTRKAPHPEVETRAA